MISFRTSFFFVSLLLTCQVAIAQDSDVNCTECRSPRRGAMLSLSGTVVPIALGTLLASSGSGAGGTVGIPLVVGGALFGPGIGHVYAGRTGHFFAGAGIRTLGLAISAASVLRGFDESFTPDAAWWIVWGGGLGIYTFSAVYDIATASRGVERYNKKLQQTQVSLYTGRIGERQNYGLTLRITF